MNAFCIFFLIGYSSMVASLPSKETEVKSNLADSSQAKRDLSLSYAATDIGSKEGTRVKTITVIKNIAGKKEKALKIDPNLHKNDDWGSHFRDNFDAYGAIPDVPDIDELFAFVNKKEEKKPKEEDSEPQTEAPAEDDAKSEEADEESKEAVTTASPAPIEEESAELVDDKVEKIQGDAELIQPGGKPGKVKSQSLDLGKYRVKETFQEANPLHTASGLNKHEKYIQSASAPYYYPQPSQSYPVNPNLFPNAKGYSTQAQNNRGGFSVTTPSGRTFDIPDKNVSDTPPYIAPNFRRIPNSPSVQQMATSSQRPYIAPNVRKNYEIQSNNGGSIINNNFFPNTTKPVTQRPAINVYRNIPTNIRTNSFGIYKPNIPRSRGLRY